MDKKEEVKKSPLACGEYVVIRQTMTAKKQAIILQGMEAEKAMDIDFKILDVGNAVPETQSINIGDTPIFSKDMRPLTISMENKPDETGSGSMFIIVHYQQIVAKES